MHRFHVCSDNSRSEFEKLQWDVSAHIEDEDAAPLIGVENFLIRVCIFIKIKQERAACSMNVFYLVSINDPGQSQ